MYEVVFHLKGDKQASFQVENDEIDNFLSEISNNRPYYNKKKTAGIWMQGAEVQYFEIKKKYRFWNV